jgi:hypothetical protein
MPIKSTSQNLGRKSAILHRAPYQRLLEQLRQKLIQFFLIRGHSTDAEYLTDDVIDRLLKKMCEDSLQSSRSEQLRVQVYRLRKRLRKMMDEYLK